jgi:hypothetical protein
MRPEEPISYITDIRRVMHDNLSFGPCPSLSYVGQLGGTATRIKLVGQSKYDSSRGEDKPRALAVDVIDRQRTSSLLYTGSLVFESATNGSLT